MLFSRLQSFCTLDQQKNSQLPTNAFCIVRSGGLENFAATTCHTVYVINLAIDQDLSFLLKEKISSGSLTSSYIPGQTKWAVLMIEMVKFFVVYFLVQVR